MSSHTLMYPNDKLHHLITVEGLKSDDLTAILDQADEYVKQGLHLAPKLTTLSGKTVINAFFEPSTRTRCSFELAARRLGAEVLNLDIGTSSTTKGETLLDTIYTLEAMYADIFVIRHTDIGTCDYVVKHLKSQACVLNGGDGAHAHPTQALLDMLTIKQHKSKFENLNVAIVGDILHSRVARSDIAALKKLGVKSIRAIGPENLLPMDNTLEGVEIFHDFNQGIQDADVIMMLRVQKERMQSELLPDEASYFKHYGLTTEKLAHANPDAIVMHPGPMNRGIEIASDVADGPQSVILQQVNNGVAIRMAVMKLLTA